MVDVNREELCPAVSNDESPAGGLHGGDSLGIQPATTEPPANVSVALDGGESGPQQPKSSSGKSEEALEPARPGEGRALVQIAIMSALLFLTLLGVLVSYPIQIYGDSVEYLGMAASIVKDRNLVYDDNDQIFTGRWGDPETLMPFVEEGHLTKMDKQDIRVWGTHSFYYPLLILPFLMLFGIKGAVLVNIGLFVAIFAMLARVLARVSANLAFGLGTALALLLCTPLISYVFWVHTEISLFFALSASLFALNANRPILGAALLGWAASQKPPLIVAFGLFLLWLFIRDRNYRKIFIAGLVMVCVMAPQLLYNIVSFGSLSSLGGWVDPALISWERFLTFWLGPARGMIWFFPLLFWCVLRSSRPWWWTLACVLAALVISAGSCVVSIFYGHEVGIRYAVYVYPLFLELRPVWKNSWTDIGALGLALFLAGGLLLNPLNNLAIWQVYPNPYPSRLLVDTGLELYPETFQRAGYRLPREITVDYVDTDLRMRRSRVQIMARRLRDPEIVVKLFCEPFARLPGSAMASLQIAGSPAVSEPLKPNAVTTLFSKTTPENLRATTLPSVQPFGGGENQFISIMEITLQAPLYMPARGNGRLWWTGLSHPDDPMSKSYVYQAGPRIVGIYPGRSWFVDTMASDGLAVEGLVQNRFNSINPSIPVDNAELVEGNNVEGATSIRLSAGKRDGEERANFITAMVDFESGPAFENKFEIVGWFRSDTLKSWGLTAIFDVPSAGEKVVPLGKMNASHPWQFFGSPINVPEGATGIRLLFSLDGAGGRLYLDDIVVSKWWDPWH